MTVQVANALYRYFEALYELNQTIIRLCGIDVMDNNEEYEKSLEKVIQLIPRLVPYTYDKTNSVYKITDSDGLLEFSDQILFLKENYQGILQKHYVFLRDVKTIRNKLEHRMHGAKFVASGSGSSCLFEIIYEINGERFIITAAKVIACVKEINVLFSEIQNLVAHYAYEHDKTEYAYYRRLERFSFQDFNKIYESDLLRLIGKTLLPF